MVGRLGNENEKTIDLDDIPDLSTPSNTTVFTDLPTKKGRLYLRSPHSVA